MNVRESYSRALEQGTLDMGRALAYLLVQFRVQGGWGGWPTGNGKKLSSCQAQLGQATCLAVA